VYVLVRKDLSHAVRAVQSSHACIQAARDSLISSEKHPSLVVLGIPDEKDLLAHSNRLKQAGIAHSMFFEDDLDSHTALATRCIDKKEERKLFQNLKLV